MARTLEPEDRIAHYRVVGPLGAGGMGEVYIVQDEKLERNVALKVLPPHLVRNEERVRRFVTEARSASSLNHPNIVTVHDIGHARVEGSRGGADAPTEPLHYMAMELVAGDTLGTLIHQHKTDLRTLLGHLAQVAEGVAKAHAAGIVHRDLKPGNIMVSKDGFAKVLDFGLAKLTERPSVSDGSNFPTASPGTGEGVVMGTVGYMSPEQVQGKTVDHRSDIFSFGCILYEAATRRRPFAADSDVEVLHRILKDKPVPVEELNPEVPGEVRRLIRRCLAKAPDQRFQSMKDLAIDLRELVEEWDSLSPSSPSGSSVASGTAPAVAAGRGRGFWAAVGLVALVGVGALGFGLARRGGGREPAPVQPDLKMSVLMSRDDLVGTALSADGRYLAYVTARDRRFSLSVRQVRTGSDVVILADNDAPVSGVNFSPDGDYLYFLNRDKDSPNYSALFQVPSLGGPPRKILFDVDSAVSFSPDGKRACFRRGILNAGADAVLVVEIDTARERELFRVKSPEQLLAAPAWSPDGKTILAAVQAVAGGVKTRLVAIDVETAASTTLGTRTWLAVDSVRWMPDGRAALASGLDLAAGGAFQVFRVSYPGGEAVRITNDLDGYTDLSVAREGSSVAAVRRAVVNNLWVARVDDKQEPQPITFASGSAGSIGRLVPLPGGAAAFSAPRGNETFLWRIDASGKNRRQLTSQGVFVIEALYAKGAGLVFSQVEAADNPVAHVWRIDPDGGGLRQLTQGTGEQLLDLAASGTALAFSRWEDPRTVWVLELDGSEPRKLVEGTAEDSRLSPDGTRLLYATLEDVQGRFVPRRHVMSVDGSAPRYSLSLPVGATNVSWTSDGRALTYVDRGEGWNLMRKELPEGTPQRLTSFEDGQVVDHVWSPDGSRMVIHHRVDGRDSVWAMKPGDPKATLITEFKTGRLARHFWAPDEGMLYFTYGNTSQDVVMITGVE